MSQGTKVSTLCDDGWSCKACPEIFTDDSAPADKQVAITDDFGNTVHMSKAQLQIFAAQAKSGTFDGI